MKIPQPVKLPSGKWRVQVQLNGQRIGQTFDTKKEAVYWAAGIKTEEKVPKEKPKEMTVGTAIDKYIALKDGVIAQSTIEGYKRIRKNALQELMDTRLCDLRREQVQSAVSRMARDKSPKSVKNAYGLVTAALNVFYPDLALKATLPQKKKVDIQIPTEKEIEQIIAAVKGYAVELPVLLALCLGLRMSEIRGLMWQDVEGDVLHIRRVLVDEGKRDSNKTYDSTRDLIMPQYIIDLIEAQDHTKEYIVPQSRRRIYDAYVHYTHRAGIKHFRFHDLRHANASVMMKLNVPDGYAKERMGHATMNMLHTVYQHTFSDEQRKIAKRMNKYFESKLK